MPESETKILTDEQSSTIIVTGPFNFSPPGETDYLGDYSTSSYTVGRVVEVADSAPLGAPDKPLNAGGVRALDSVLRSRTPDAAILRDSSGEL